MNPIVFSPEEFQRKAKHHDHFLSAVLQAKGREASVSWKQWLAKGDIKAHQTSKRELDNLGALIAHDLADTAIVGLSLIGELRPPTTLLSSHARSPSRVLDIGSARAGGSTKSPLKQPALALGPEAVALADYFDACRRKRNVIEYMNSSVATDNRASR